MRKFFTFLAATAVAASAQAATETLFDVDFSTAAEADFGKWTVIDANNDEKTWSYDAAGTPSRVFYTYHSTNTGDDWLISPAITFPKAGSYILSFEYQGSSYGEKLEVWTGSAPTATGMTNNVKNYDANAQLRGEMLFIEAPAGPLHIGFHATSLPDKWRIYIKSVKLMSSDNPVDLAVTEIVTPESGENLGQETVTVNVTNKGRVDVNGFDVSYQLNDGEPVTEHCNKTLAVGQTEAFTFATKADLSQGHFTHTLKAWTSHPDDLNPANDATTAQVKHIAPAAVPYYMGFEPTDDTSGITFLNLNGDDGDWGINIDSFFMKMARNGYGSLCYNYNKENAGDDWAILEPIQMEPGYYVVKFWYSSTENHTERMKLFYGDANTPEAMTNLVIDLNNIDNPKYKESINIIEIKKSGPVFFGFYAYSDADENWLCIDDFSIEAVDPNKNDVILSDLTTPTDYFFASSSRNATFTVQNVGIQDATVTLKYYLDGKMVKESTQTVRGQEILTVTAPDVLPENLAAGTHSFKVEATVANDTDETNNILERSIIVLDAPVAFWDFEDGQLPSDLTLRKEDSATDHPNAGEEFNEDGFGIFNLEHYLLGQHALAVNTWFTESDRSADRWIVLPLMEVTGPDAHIAWTANSFNNTYREHYEVKVSTTEDKWYEYSTLYTNTAEDIAPQTHGVSLADYEGKKVHLAFNVRTQNGEALILDNIGVYGNIKRDNSGITGITAESDLSVYFEGQTLCVLGEGVDSLTLHSVNGAKVAEVKGNTIDLTGMPKGIYIVSANGSIHFKVAK